MYRRLVSISVLAVILAVMLAGGQPATSQAQTAGCVFQLGFKVLHDMIPETVGQCIENEWHNPYNGDGLQRTTKGLEVWRKIDNWTAFTDGYWTWVNGPLGLQQRLNSERFDWEGPAAATELPEAVARGARARFIMLPSGRIARVAAALRAARGARTSAAATS